MSYVPSVTPPDLDLRKWLYIEMERIPTHVTVCLTWRCDLACGHCGQAAQPRTCPELPPGEWIRLLNGIQWNRSRLTFFGGEPALYPHLAEVLEGVGSRTLEIVSNGTHLEPLLEFLVKRRVDVVLSLDGVGRTHDQVRGRKGLFDHLVRLMERFREVKERLGSSSRLTTNTVLLPQNLEELPDLLEVGRKMKVDRMQFQHPDFVDGTHLLPEGVPRLVTDFTQRVVLGLGADHADQVVEACQRLEQSRQKGDPQVVYLPRLSPDLVRQWYGDGLSNRYPCPMMGPRPLLAPNGDLYRCRCGPPAGNARTSTLKELAASASAVGHWYLKEPTICRRCCQPWLGP